MVLPPIDAKHADLEESFRQLVAAELAPLRRFARTLTPDSHRAEDLAQSALEKMYLAWPRVHAGRNPAAYLRTIVVRQAIGESRRAWRRERQMHAMPEQACEDSTPSALLRLDLTKALATLTVKQRAIVMLRYVEDRPLREVAETMGITIGTVKRQSATAVSKLRRALGEGFVDGSPGQVVPAPPAMRLI
jgi:RNA polymerase sigma-70 factor (sigma-E family)